MIGTPVRKAMPSVQKSSEDDHSTAKYRVPRLQLTCRREKLETEMSSLRLSAKHMEEDEQPELELIPLAFSQLSWSKEIGLVRLLTGHFNDRNEQIRELFDQNATVITGPEFKSQGFAGWLGSLAGQVSRIEIGVQVKLYSTRKTLNEVVVSCEGRFHTSEAVLPISLTVFVDISQGLIREIRVSFLRVEPSSNTM